MRLSEIVAYLQTLAPLELAEEWDNVGLLVGDPQQDVQRVLTCLTLSPDVAQEAIERNVQLVVTHHPVLFRPVQKIVASDSAGRMLLDLIAARVAVYSPHTAYDSAPAGVNQQLAELFGLSEIVPLREVAGRAGNLPAAMTLDEFVDLVKTRLQTRSLEHVGNAQRLVRRVAIACGSGGEFLRDAIASGCDVLLTGEARFHAALEAEAAGIGLVLAGHYATERPALERLAERLGQEFPALSATASQVERDPLSWR